MYQLSRDLARLATAIWNYNHSQAYVNEVLTLASAYGVLTLPDGVAFAASADLLRNPRVILTPNARADLKAGDRGPETRVAAGLDRAVPHDQHQRV